MDLRPPPRCGIMMRTRCWNTADDLAQAVAEEIAREAARVETAPHALMLAGGTTPLAAYAQLTTHPPRVDSNLHVLFSDDRHVPEKSPHSNLGQIRPMLNAWALPSQRLLCVHGDYPLATATQAYDQALGAFLGQGGVISLGLLGLGADGHTASLFSTDHVAQGQAAWALSVSRPDGMSGVSVTPRLLREVQRIIFVVSGTGKRAMAEKLVKQPRSITAGLAVAGHGKVELWTDRAAWPFD